MDYRTAYEALSSALWQYGKSHEEAYVRLMRALRDIDCKLNERPKPPITWPPNNEPGES